jgi:hypothetical protein
MYQAPPVHRINLSLPEVQHDALDRLSKERNVPVQQLIRAGIAAVTGVPDPIRKTRRYGREYVRGGKT